MDTSTVLEIFVAADLRTHLRRLTEDLLGGFVMCADAAEIAVVLFAK